MLMHATGFHGRCWLPLAPALASEFSVWSIDQRGHGDAGKAPDGKYDDWSAHVEDLIAVLDALGMEGWRGLGHSLGGAVLLLAEATKPGTFANLCCYEPVVVPPVGSIDREGFAGQISMSDLARKRRATFASRQEARENFGSKPPMNSFDPAALEAYVEYGFINSPAGGVTIACTGDDEASTYEGAPESGAWDRLDQVRAPVLILGGGDMRDPVSTFIDDVARRLPRGGTRRLGGLSHFGPMEDPLGVGRIAAEAFGSSTATSAGDGSTVAVAPRS
jgi:pimeloyl-ACP methyl ester carboxylesterase